MRSRFTRFLCGRFRFNSTRKIYATLRICTLIFGITPFGLGYTTVLSKLTVTKNYGYKSLASLPDDGNTADFRNVLLLSVGPGSVVCIATTYGLDGPGIESSLLRDALWEGSIPCASVNLLRSVPRASY